MRRTIPALLVLIALALPARAAAQIYSWRDAGGNLVLSNTPPIYSWRDARGNRVLSNTPPPGHQRSYPTPRRDAQVRTSRPAEMTAGGRFDALIAQYAKEYSVSPGLVRAVIQVESAFDPAARSPKGAMGLMQLMPATAIEMGVDNPYDPEQNIRGGVAYLRHLLNRYAGDVTLALAAYNAGPGAVERNGYRVPYAETRSYVSQVTSRSGGAGRAAVTGPAAKGGAPRPQYLYKWVEIIDGRPVTKYADTRPATGPYEVVPQR